MGAASKESFEGRGYRSLAWPFSRGSSRGSCTMKILCLVLVLVTVSWSSAADECDANDLPCKKLAILDLVAKWNADECEQKYDGYHPMEALNLLRSCKEIKDKNKSATGDQEENPAG